MKDFGRLAKGIDVPDIVQDKAQYAFARIQEESRMSTYGNIRRRSFKGHVLLVAAIVAVLLIGGGVVWAATGGLAGFLSESMPSEEIIKRLDTPAESAIQIEQRAIQIDQTEVEDYGPLWTIEEYWYDGATLYFTARAPQKVIDAGNMMVVWKDHSSVNGTDCPLSADGCWEEGTGRYTGFYVCEVDLANADTSSGHVSVVIRLQLNKYKLMPAFFCVRPNNEIETLAEQELSFDFDKPNDMRQTKDKNLAIKGGTADVSMSAAPSLLNVSIVYHLNDSSKPVKDIVGYRITDDKGSSITVCVSASFKDYSNDDCLVITEHSWEGLDPYSKSYTFEPLSFRLDSAGNRVPDEYDSLDWGGFKVEFK